MCGCGGTVVNAAERAASAAAMCACCSHREGPLSDSGARCGLTGQTLAVMVGLTISRLGEHRGAACERHPDVRGVCHLNGVACVGVPAPVRWWLRRGRDRGMRDQGSKGRRGERKEWAGCGCVRVLKVMWRMAGRRLRRLRPFP